MMGQVIIETIHEIYFLFVLIEKKKFVERNEK